MRVVALVALPLDGLRPVASSKELGQIRTLVGRSAGDWSLELASPARPGERWELRGGDRGGILHIVCHGSSQEVEVMDEFGSATYYGVDDFAHRVGAGWNLVIMSGCDTHVAAKTISDLTGTPTIGFRGELSNLEAERFTRSLYGFLVGSSPGAHVDVAAALHASAKGATWLANGPERTILVVAPDSRDDLDRWLQLEQLAGEVTAMSPDARAALLIANRDLGSSTQAAVLALPVHEAADIARIAVAWSYLFSGCDTRVYWCAGAQSSGLSPARGPDVDGVGAPYESCRTREGHKIFVCSPLGACPLGHPEPERMVPSGPVRGRVSMRGGSDLPDLAATGLSGLLRTLPFGRLVAAVVNHLKEAPPELVALACSRLAKREQRLAPHAKQLTYATVETLVRNQLIRAIVWTSAGPIHVGGISGPLNARLVPGMAAARLSREEVLVVDEVAVAYALVRGRSGALSTNDDAVWIAHVADRLSGTLRGGLLLRQLFVGLGPEGYLRRDVDLNRQRTLATKVRTAALRFGELDEVAQLCLVVGETHYLQGDLASAEREFRKILALDVSPSRHMQAHRALGQVQHRRGAYRRAVRSFDRALAVDDGTNLNRTATTLQARARSLSRLHRHGDAVKTLADVLTKRQAAGDSRNIVKALHELGAAEMRAGLTGEAIGHLNLCLELARKPGIRRAANGARYELGVHALESGDEVAARRHLRQLDSSLKAAPERLWAGFAALLAARVAVSQGRYGEAITRLSEACTIGDASEYRRLREDVEEWVLHTAAGTLCTPCDPRLHDFVIQALGSTQGLRGAKCEKALRYAVRVEKTSRSGRRIVSDHGVRVLHRRSLAGWTCTCPLFADTGMCSHVVAVKIAEISGSTRGGSTDV